MTEEEPNLRQPEKYPWPHKGDKPFVDGGNWYARADLDFLRFIYAKSMVAQGYRDAAERIIASVEAQISPPYPDMLFCPVAFLYRHFLELAMKDLLRDGLRLGAIEATCRLDKALEEHDLQALWRRTRILLERVFAEADREPIDAVEEVVLAFHSLDPKGQAFRYRHDKGGQPQLQNAPKAVDLVKMREVMRGVCAFLQGCGDAITEIIRSQPENENY
jgi:hypothetical protein